MGALDAVTRGVNVGIRRAHPPVDLDSAQAAELEAGAFGEIRVGAHAHGEDDEVRVQSLASADDGLDTAFFTFEGRYLRTGAHGDPLVVQVLLHEESDLGVQHREDARKLLDQGDVEGAVRQTLCHLHAYQATTDDDGSLRLAARDRCLYPLRVLNLLHLEDVCQIHSENRWHDGPGSRCQYELVVGHPSGTPVGEAAVLDAPVGTVDGDGFGAAAYLHVLDRLEERHIALRASGGAVQILAIVHHPGDEVREPAPRVGEDLASLEHRDVGSRLETRRLARGLHPRGDPADNDKIQR
jgi:hypothetical protein